MITIAEAKKQAQSVTDAAKDLNTAIAQAQSYGLSVEILVNEFATMMNPNGQVVVTVVKIRPSLIAEVASE